MSLAAWRGARGQLGFFGMVLLFVFLVWLQLAFLLLMLFLGGAGLPPPSAFMHELLFTPRGLGLLIVGTIVGGADRQRSSSRCRRSPCRCCWCARSMR